MPDALPQRLTLDVFRRDEVSPFDLPDVMYGENVGMIQRGGRARLLLESPQSGLASRVACGQELQRHFATEPGVFGKVDLSHAARADQADDFVMADCLARGQFGLFFSKQVSRG